MGDKDDVVLSVFFYHEPRSAAESEAFPLTDGMEPEALMFSKHFACLYFNDVAFFLSHIFADIVVIVYFAEEADAL